MHPIVWVLKGLDGAEVGKAIEEGRVLGEKDGTVLGKDDGTVLGKKDGAVLGKKGGNVLGKLVDGAGPCATSGFRLSLVNPTAVPTTVATMAKTTNAVIARTVFPLHWFGRIGVASTSNATFRGSAGSSASRWSSSVATRLASTSTVASYAVVRLTALDDIDSGAVPYETNDEAL
jgi:hypothetical protein